MMALAVVYAAVSIAANVSLSSSIATLESDGRPMKLAEVIPEDLEDSDNAAFVYQAMAFQLKTIPSDGTDALSTLGRWGRSIVDGEADETIKAQFSEFIKTDLVNDALALIKSARSKKGSNFNIEYSRGFDREFSFTFLRQILLWDLRPRDSRQ